MNPDYSIIPEPLKTEVGHTVAYTRRFLKSIMAPATDPLWRRTGVVQAIDGRFALILWDGDEKPVFAALSNLAHPGPNLRYCE